MSLQGDFLYLNSLQGDLFLADLSTGRFVLICSLLIALKVIDLLQLNTLQSVLFVADHSKG